MCIRDSKTADEAMVKEGIVAVGDISNKADTKATKDKSSIRYYSFVEMFDFMQEGWAGQKFEKYKVVFDEQTHSNGNKKSVVPHAPYTVSKNLYRLINETNSDDSTVSIHNQETPSENQLFQNKTGDFLDFYKNFNICLLYTSPSPRDQRGSRMPSSA